MKASSKAILLVVLALGVLSVAACGGAESAGNQGKSAQEHEKTEAEGGGMASEMLMEDGEYSDVKFIDAMIPHHQGAVEMAQVALENARHEELRKLSRQIIAAQEEEIETLQVIRERETGNPSMPMDMGDGSGEMMGMVDSEKLANERPFDRAFIDAMIPHHESAIEMAQVASEESDIPEIQGLAEDIIEAQTLEIDRLSDWREEWYPEG